MRWKMNKSIKWSWFEVPVKAQQINDTVPSQKAVNDVKVNDCENDYEMK